MNWQDSIKAYQEYLTLERGFSKNSTIAYSNDIFKLKKYLECYSIMVSPETVEETVLKQFVYEQAKKISPKSQARLISSLKSFFKYLITEGVITSNPVLLIETPKIGKKLPDTLSESEINRMVACIDLSKPEGHRNKAIVETLYSCGLRVSELLTMQLSHLFFEEGFVKVLGKGNKERWIPIATKTIELINIYTKNNRRLLPISKQYADILFLNKYGRPLSRAMIFTIVKRLSREANITKVVSPHTLRHSFASHLLQNGADLRAIQQMLGHESITTTEIYVHLDHTHIKTVINKYHPRNKID